MNGGYTPCHQLRPYSGKEHTVFGLIQSGDEDGKKKGKATENRKSSVALYDKPGYRGPSLGSVQ